MSILPPPISLRIPVGEELMQPPPRGEVAPAREIACHALDLADLVVPQFVPEAEGEHLSQVHTTSEASRSKYAPRYIEQK
mgnify:CR=1 FL=1